MVVIVWHEIKYYNHCSTSSDFRDVEENAEGDVSGGDAAGVSKSLCFLFLGVRKGVVPLLDCWDNLGIVILRPDVA